MAWFGPNGDCGCCDNGLTPNCCGSKTCLTIQLTIAGVTCCPAVTVSIGLQYAFSDDDGCHFVHDAGDATGDYYLDGSFDFVSWDKVSAIPCVDVAGITTCFNYVDGLGVARDIFAYSIKPEVILSTTNSVVVVNIFLQFAQRVNPYLGQCFVGAAGFALHTFSGGHCLAGPFSEDSVSIINGVTWWSVPDCEITIDSIVEC